MFFFVFFNFFYVTPKVMISHKEDLAKSGLKNKNKQIKILLYLNMLKNLPKSSKNLGNFIFSSLKCGDSLGIFPKSSLDHVVTMLLEAFFLLTK